MFIWLGLGFNAIFNNITVISWRSVLFYAFFKKKENILIPNVAEKNILILVEEKKNNLTLMMSEKKILNETKNHNVMSE